MSTTVNSFSSSLMYEMTASRNEESISKKFGAQFGYSAIVGVALIEAVTALGVTVLSLIACPFSTAPLKFCAKWLGSSSFCIGWAVVDFVLNPFVVKLVADEASAKQMFFNRNLIELPQDAVF